ncbi:MAG TPA: polysaccharide biosynthesis C-terminal domain-containing protein [Ferruginibacter sp.]|nr:polysaccharide biosynthesis C-terminal domain-containing protein [Ferruginibacter sp.]
MQAGRTLFQSIVWRGLYYVAAFIINILIARHFQASVSGAVYYISSIYALVLLFLSLGLESGIIYFAARNGIPLARLFSFSIAWSLLAGLSVFFAVYVFFPGEYVRIPGPLLLFSSVCFISGNLLTTYCSGFYYARNDFILPNAVNITCTIILVIVLPYGGRSVIPGISNENYFYVYFGSFLVQGIWVAAATKIKYIKSGFQQLLSLEQFRLLFRYCAMAFVGNIIYFLLYRVDYWFVENYCTPEQLGNYIQVSKLGHLFLIVPTILASAVFPITAGGKKENLAQLLTLLSRSIFFVYLFVCVVLILTGQWLFPFVFGESFSGMYMPFLFLIPGILSLSGLFTLTAYFAGNNQVKKNMLGALYALALVLAGNMLFIPKYGINAAALISSLGYMVYHVYILGSFSREHKIPVSDFYVFRYGDWIKIRNGLLNIFTKNDIADQP